MTILVTGAAGFIGFHVSKALLDRGETVIGIDNINDYYDVNLKQARLNELKPYKNFTFYKIDIADRDAMITLGDQHAEIDRVIHLAAQAGVRYSLTHPFAYADTNLVGQLTILELCRTLPNLKHLVYASSSSVYGANEKMPFSIEDRVDHPISLYAATKKSAELMSHCYSHLYRIPTTGLRYFTVYGPWGRPDMAAFIFTKAILIGEELPVFNHGEMHRNFSYIDDVVKGTLGCLDHPPKDRQQETQQNVQQNTQTPPPYKLYNIGNNRSEPLLHFIEILENALGKKSKLRMEPMQPGDIKNTVADITASTQDFGYMPTTNIEDGLPQFVDWYRAFYHV